MPVTARLSRKFYEKLGEDIAQEFVDWFNMVDATYRDDLRETNELNFARFDAKLEQRITQLDAKLEQRIAGLDTKLTQRIAGLDAKLTQRIMQFEAKLEQRVTQLEAKLEQRITQLDTKIEVRLAEQTALLLKELAGVEMRMAARNAAARADLIKWTFVFWSTSALVVIGIVTRFL